MTKKTKKNTKQLLKLPAKFFELVGKNTAKIFHLYFKTVFLILKDILLILNIFLKFISLIGKGTIKLGLLLTKVFFNFCQIWGKFIIKAVILLIFFPVRLSSTVGSFVLSLLKIPYFLCLLIISPRKATLIARGHFFLWQENFKHSFSKIDKTCQNFSQKSFSLQKSLGNFFAYNQTFVLRPILFFFRSKKRAFATISLSFSFFCLLYLNLLKDLPSPYTLKGRDQAVSTKIYDRNGKLLFTLYNGDTNRILANIDQLPEPLIKATLAIEDEQFFSHTGISFRGIARAIRNNYLSFKTKGHLAGDLQGGSTITQQLIKNALLTSEKSLKRKVREAILALQVEFLYSKKEILQMYFNEVNYGGTAYGVEAAAQAYFGKSARDVDLAQSTLLAGLPAAPTKNSPFGTHPAKAKERQIQVLARMVKAGFITKDEAKKAAGEKIELAPKETNIFAPHFVMYVRDFLTERYGRVAVEEGGLEVTTTLDWEIQKKAQEVVTKTVEELEGRYNFHNAAALVTKPKTGEVLAMVGSRGFFDKSHDGNVNLTLSLQQPGSAIKVVNYSYALAHGWTPTSTVLDSPVTYTDQWGNSYSPRNYDDKYRGPVTVRQALAMSLNVPAVRVLYSYGAEKMREQGVRMGLENWRDLTGFGLSLTLGAAEVRMVDMAVVYGSVANLGMRKNLNPILKIVDHNGQVWEDVSREGTILAQITQKAYASFGQEDSEEVVSPVIAYQLTNILSDNAARMPAFGPYAKLEIPGHKVAVKTGTSNEMRDNWTIGFTPEYLVTTWVGNNDNTPMSKISSGITGAAPIWNEIMSFVLKDKQPAEFSLPEGLIPVKICATNGLLTCPRCPQEKIEYFVPGSEPKQACNFPINPCGDLAAKLQKEGKSKEEIDKAFQGCQEEQAKKSQEKRE